MTYRRTWSPGKQCLKPANSFWSVYWLQFSSVTQSCLTLCDPMDCGTPGFPVYHQLPEFTQTHVHWVGDAIQLSHPLSSPWVSEVSEVAQSCPTLGNPMDCSLPGSSIHGIFQARVLEWGAIAFSRRSSRPRDWTRLQHCRQTLYHLSHQGSCIPLLDLK